MTIEAHFRALDKIPIDHVEQWLTRDKMPPISEETARAVYAKFLSARRQTKSGGRNGGPKSGAQWYIARGLVVPADLPQRKTAKQVQEKGPRKPRAKKNVHKGHRQGE